MSTMNSVVSSGSADSLSGAERSAVAAAAAAIGGTAVGARPDVEEAERKEAGRGKRSFDAEGAEEVEERA